MTDQQRADHLGCMGNDILKTPNLDRIAAHGVRFDRFYVVNPICQPNRASIATGRYPSSHGVRCNGIPLSNDARTYVHVLRDAGYQTVMVGKSHLQNITGLPATLKPQGKGPFEYLGDQVRDADERRLTGDDYEAENTQLWKKDPDRYFPLPFYGFDRVDLCTMHGDEVSSHFERWIRDRHPNPESLRGPDNALPKGNISTPRAWRTAMPEELYPTTFIAERTCAHIDRIATGENDAPFFIKCSFPDPHAPFTPPGKYWSMYDPDDMPVPASFGKGTSPVLEHMRRVHADSSDKRAVELPFAVTEREAQEALALTYGMISMIDDAVGRILDRLEAQGLLDSTIIVYMSDHGDEMGDHGIMQKGPLHYRGSVRVPFIWSDPDNGSQAGTLSDELGSSVDFAQTLLSRLGLAQPYGMQGVDLAPAISGVEQDLRDYVYLEDDRERIYLGFDQPQRLRTLITKTHRLTVFNPMDWSEMFNLQDDPGEIENLWDIPAHRDMRAALVEQLLHAGISCGERLPFLKGMA